MMRVERELACEADSVASGDPAGQEGQSTRDCATTHIQLSLPTVSVTLTHLVRHLLTKEIASGENLLGSLGTVRSEPMAKMAAIGFISALKSKYQARLVIAEYEMQLP